MLINTGE